MKIIITGIMMLLLTWNTASGQNTEPPVYVSLAKTGIKPTNSENRVLNYSQDIFVYDEINNGNVEVYTSKSMTAKNLISNNSSVIFTSSEKIRFERGFEVKAGSRFVAKLAKSDMDKTMKASMNDNVINTVVMDDVELDLAKVYPNPSNGVLFVDILEQNSKTQLYVYNTSGQLVSSTISEGLNAINLQENLPGVYYLKIVNDKHIETKKIILN